jgi:hypothetical protein
VKGYVVTYSVRYTDGACKGRMYHRHASFLMWKNADAFARETVGHDALGNYTQEDSIVTAVPELALRAELMDA